MYLQIFICHPTCVVVLQCWETTGMFLGVMGCSGRVGRQRIRNNYFIAYVIPELMAPTVCELVFDALMLALFLYCSYFAV